LCTSSIACSAMGIVSSFWTSLSVKYRIMFETER
jgi:hypothetical protein